jgi:hypothetical protein
MHFINVFDNLSKLKIFALKHLRNLKEYKTVADTLRNIGRGGGASNC